MKIRKKILQQKAIKAIKASNQNFLELLLRISYLLSRPGDHDAENAILLASREVAEVSRFFL